jgi:D-alanine-D-alanine ligase
VQPISELIPQNYDHAVVLLHGRGGEDGTMQGLLECLKIPYTGSGVLASSLALDKYRTKMIWNSVGVPIAKSQYLTKKNYNELEFKLNFALPVIVKPNSGGSTLGMKVAHSLAELNVIINQIFAEYDDTILIEEFVVGEEFTIVISDGHALPIIKIEFPKHKDSYDYQDKYFTDESTYICPFDFGNRQSEIIDYALRGYHAVGASGITRSDFLISKSGQVYFLEINTIPGMTSHSFVPMAFKAIGANFDELCLYMLGLAKLGADI